MSRCPGCGGSLPAAARFCPLCGKTVSPSSTTGAPAVAPSGTARAVVEPPGPSGASADRRRLAIAAGAAAALIGIGLILFLVARGGVLTARDTNPSGGVIVAPPVEAPAPVLAPPTPQAPSAPVMTPPRAQANVMPDDVADYLRWLKQVEAYRKNLEADGIAKLQTVMQTVLATYMQKMLEMANPEQDAPAPQRDTVSVDVGKILQDWNRLTGDFLKRTPPAPCAALHNHYRGALSTSVGEMSQLAQVITSVQKMGQGGDGSIDQLKDKLTSLNKEKATRSTSQNVDNTYGAANQALDAVRGQYDVMPGDIRDFKIEGGNAGFTMPSMPGLPGM